MTSLVGAVLVAVCGGLGAVLRWQVDRAVSGRASRRGSGSPRVPGSGSGPSDRWLRALPRLGGTGVVNVSGSFALGLLLGAGSAVLPEEVHLALTVGLLGGYTTFSTASLEAVQVGADSGAQSTRGAVLHAGAMLLGSVIAAALGMALGLALAPASGTV